MITEMSLPTHLSDAAKSQLTSLHRTTFVAVSCDFGGPQHSPHAAHRHLIRRSKHTRSTIDPVLAHRPQALTYNVDILT
jgi:hypothetical protein